MIALAHAGIAHAPHLAPAALLRIQSSSERARAHLGDAPPRPIAAAHKTTARPARPPAPPRQRTMSDFDERDASDDEPELNEEEVLEQLQELHRQLSAERQKDEVDATPSLLEPPKNSSFVPLGRPVRFEKPFGEASFKYETVSFRTHLSSKRITKRRRRVPLGGLAGLRRRENFPRGREATAGR